MDTLDLDMLKMRDAGDVEQAVRAALAAEQPLEIIGHGSKRGIGQPVSATSALDVSALDEIVSYEPGELILTTQAGAKLADVLTLIDAQNQQFAFDPMDTAPLLGSNAGRGTIGGMVASGLAGSRRIQAGGVRDHLLGAAAVSGFGDSFRTGGKVVKNVTGYDLCKLLNGSWGTLAVMTELTLKVLPKAEDEITLVLGGLDDVVAGQAMTAALGSPFDVSGAAHIPKNALSADFADLGHDAVTLIRLEGITASVLHRAGTLETLLEPFGKAARLDAIASGALWASIRDVKSFAASGPMGTWPVWRIVCPPAAGGALGEAIARESGAAVVYDWAGGLIWAAMPPSEGDIAGDAARLRARVAASGGHAMLFRADETHRAAIDVFHPQPDGVAALMRRVKASFDPKNILNPGRMVRETAS